MPSLAQARRNLLLGASAGCPASADVSGGWCDETSGKWMCGQVECGSLPLPEGCQELEGELRCADAPPLPGTSPIASSARPAALLSLRAPLLLAAMLAAAALVDLRPRP